MVLRTQRFILLFLIGLFYLPIEVVGQEPTFTISLKDSKNEQALAMCVVELEGSNRLFFSDGNGKVIMPVSFFGSAILVRHPEFVPYRGIIESAQDTSISLLRRSLFHYEENTDEKAIALVNAARSFKGLSCFSPSGIKYEARLYIPVLDSNAAPALPSGKQNGQITSYLPRDKSRYAFELIQFGKAHVKRERFVVDESDSVYASGYAPVQLLLENTLASVHSIYDSELSIGKRRVHSFLGFAFKRKYVLRILDSALTEEGMRYLLKFHPKPSKQFDGLAGYAWISADGRIYQWQGQPAKDRKRSKQLYQEYEWKDAIPRLRFQRTEQIRPYFAKLSYLGYVQEIFFRDSIWNKTISKDYVIQLKEEIIVINPDSSRLRQGTYDQEERSTFAFFEENVLPSSLLRTAKITEGIILNRYRMGKVDLEFEDLIHINAIEGVRTGIGFTTNRHFHEQLRIHANLGYGWLDQQVKYGMGLSYQLNTLYDWTVATYLRKDLFEAGGSVFAFDRAMYKTERLRRVLLEVWDLYTEWGLESQARLWKGTRAILGAYANNSSPTYDYAYRGQEITNMSLPELRLGIRVAPGEEYGAIKDYRMFIRNRLPILSAHYTNGFGEAFQYQRLEAKFQYRFRVVELGESGLQVSMGRAWGVVPYARLFNGTGSLNELSLVIHNSFETMRYNEFLSDRYVYFFFSQDIGRLYYDSDWFRPELMLSYNAGWGTIEHPDYHTGINFGLMNRGFREMGLYLDNLVFFKVSAARIGLGTGLFLRHGAYARDKLSDNTVMKFSINTKL